MTGWIMIGGVVTYAAGLLFFRRPSVGVEEIWRMPLWRADDYLTPAGIYCAFGGWGLFAIGAVWGFVQTLLTR